MVLNMTRRNVPKKVAKKQKNRTVGWDEKLKTLRKRYGSVPRRRRENTPFHMANVVVGGRLRSHMMANRDDM